MNYRVLLLLIFPLVFDACNKAEYEPTPTYYYSIEGITITQISVWNNNNRHLLDTINSLENNYWRGSFDYFYVDVDAIKSFDTTTQNTAFNSFHFMSRCYAESPAEPSEVLIDQIDSIKVSTLIDWNDSTLAGQDISDKCFLWNRELPHPNDYQNLLEFDYAYFERERQFFDYFLIYEYPNTDFLQLKIDLNLNDGEKVITTTTPKYKL